MAHFRQNRCQGPGTIVVGIREHTVATEMMSRGIDPLLARPIARHKSEKSFERYSKRALQKQAEAQFLQAMGEERFTV